MEQQGQTNLRTRFIIKEPTMYAVLMLNDDFTTMEFVVEVLRTVFFHDAAQSEKLMLDIHNNGQCIVGTYTYDVAQSKVQRATTMAREEGFPLRLKIKEKT
ncbi:MAG: ATP-dependent Clp protease adaptor ClpS [Bacteroidaceae bacterium]|nr:ATP-dependent Clp protease adaptor ClpS [Bacteroidaceae bacterium]